MSHIYRSEEMDEAIVDVGDEEDGEHDGHRLGRERLEVDLASQEDEELADHERCDNDRVAEHHLEHVAKRVHVAVVNLADPRFIVLVRINVLVDGRGVRQSIDLVKFFTFDIKSILAEAVKRPIARDGVVDIEGISIIVLSELYELLEGETEELLIIVNRPGSLTRRKRRLAKEAHDLHFFDQVGPDKEKEDTHEQDEHLGHRHVLFALLRVDLDVLKLDIIGVGCSLELEIILAKLEVALPDKSLSASPHFKGDPHQVWRHHFIKVPVFNFRHIFLDLH